MPRKALDRDQIAYMTMLVCYELGKTEEEITSWSLGDLLKWVAFFNIKAKMEKAAMDRARRKGAK